MSSSRPLLVFDSGLGGLTVLGALRSVMPRTPLVYIADDAWFPYGARSAEAIEVRVVDVIGTALDRVPADLVVIACNTASTIALPALRKRFGVPVVGTVPAIKPAAAATQSGVIAVLGTPATVTRDYTARLIAEHGRGAHVELVGARRLASLAERHALGQPVSDSEIADEIAPCFVEGGGRRTDTIVLACTHYPLLGGRLATVAPWPVTWIDPAPAIARRVASLLPDAGQPPSQGIALFTSGQVPPGAERLLARYGLATSAQVRLAS